MLGLLSSSQCTPSNRILRGVLVANKLENSVRFGVFLFMQLLIRHQFSLKYTSVAFSVMCSFTTV